MKTNHIEQIFGVIKDKKLEFIYNTHPLYNKYHVSTEKLRDCLLKLEKKEYPNGKLPQISTTNPLKLSPKYQIDFLGEEIPQICNQYCISLASAHYYFPLTSDTRQSYFYKKPDLFFWNNVDSGFRLASSGWDRLSLLLNVAFKLQLEKYNLSAVLKSMPAKVNNVSSDKNFKSLKKFRDGKFSDLELGLGEGARHETTHIMSRSTRFFLELLENFNLGSDKLEVRRENELNLLNEHYGLLLEGINQTYDLIEKYFDIKYYCI